MYYGDNNYNYILVHDWVCFSRIDLNIKARLQDSNMKEHEVEKWFGDITNLVIIWRKAGSELSRKRNENFRPSPD